MDAALVRRAQNRWRQEFLEISQLAANGNNNDAAVREKTEEFVDSNYNHGSDNEDFMLFVPTEANFNEDGGSFRFDREGAVDYFAGGDTDNGFAVSTDWADVNFKNEGIIISGGIGIVSGIVEVTPRGADPVPVVFTLSYAITRGNGNRLQRTKLIGQSFAYPFTGR